MQHLTLQWIIQTHHCSIMLYSQLLLLLVSLLIVVYMSINPHIWIWKKLNFIFVEYCIHFNLTVYLGFLFPLCSMASSGWPPVHSFYAFRYTLMMLQSYLILSHQSMVLVFSQVSFLPCLWIIPGLEHSPHGLRCIIISLMLSGFCLPALMISMSI